MSRATSHNQSTVKVAASKHLYGIVAASQCNPSRFSDVAGIHIHDIIARSGLYPQPPMQSRILKHDIVVTTPRMNGCHAVHRCALNHYAVSAVAGTDVQSTMDIRIADAGKGRFRSANRKIAADRRSIDNDRGYAIVTIQRQITMQGSTKNTQRIRSVTT